MFRFRIACQTSSAVLAMLFVVAIAHGQQEAETQQPGPVTVRPSTLTGPFSVEAINDPPAEKWLHEMMDMPIPQLDFPGDRKLSDILNVLADYFSTEHGAGIVATDFRLRMTFYPDRGELALEGINDLKELRISDFSPGGITLRSALDLIFEQTSDDTKSPVPLTYVIMNEVILVTTRDKAESDGWLYVRSYRVGSLVDAIKNAGKLGEAGAPDGDLVSLIMEMTSPQLEWNDDAGAIQFVGRTLVVKQTPQGHRKIVELLNMLSLAEDSAAPEPVPAPPGATG